MLVVCYIHVLLTLSLLLSQARSNCHPSATGCQFFANPSNFLGSFYSWFIFVDKEISPEIWSSSAGVAKRGAHVCCNPKHSGQIKCVRKISYTVCETQMIFMLPETDGWHLSCDFRMQQQQQLSTAAIVIREIERQRIFKHESPRPC